MVVVGRKCVSPNKFARCFIRTLAPGASSRTLGDIDESVVMVLFGDATEIGERWALSSRSMVCGLCEAIVSKGLSISTELIRCLWRSKKKLCS